MGVDWYTCNHCEETYSDAGHYGQCSDCEGSYCGDCYDEFIEKYGAIDETHERYRMYGKSLIECDHCNGTEVSQSELLSFALGKLKITRDELKEEYVKLTYDK